MNSALVIPGPAVRRNIGETSRRRCCDRGCAAPENCCRDVAVDLGIDVAIHQNQVGPAVVVEIEKHRAPAEILRVQAEARSERARPSKLPSPLLRYSVAVSSEKFVLKISRRPSPL